MSPSENQNQAPSSLMPEPKDVNNINTSETAYYQSDLRVSRDITKQTKPKRSALAIASFIMALTIAILFLSATIDIIMGNTDLKNLGPLTGTFYALWMLGILYLIFPISIILGVIALKNGKSQRLAIISLSINAVVIIGMIVISALV